MFVLFTSISRYISEIVLLSEYEILTAWLVNTKLLGFRLLWDVTVYVIGRQNCPTHFGCPALVTVGQFWQLITYTVTSHKRRKPSSLVFTSRAVRTSYSAK